MELVEGSEVGVLEDSSGVDLGEWPPEHLGRFLGRTPNWVSVWAFGEAENTVYRFPLQ